MSTRSRLTKTTSSETQDEGMVSNYQAEKDKSKKEKEKHDKKTRINDKLKDTLFTSSYGSISFFKLSVASARFQDLDIGFYAFSNEQGHLTWRQSCM